MPAGGAWSEEEGAGLRPIFIGGGGSGRGKSSGASASSSSSSTAAASSPDPTSAAQCLWPDSWRRQKAASATRRIVTASAPQAAAFPGAAQPTMKLESPSADPRLEFTVATEKEFEEVLAMSKGIYGGLDYLPSRYHSWIREPNRTVVLAKKNGAVIGLQSVFVIDAGETALVEGLRVAPWERGKGVAGLLQRFCAQMVKEKHPSVKVSRLTRDDKLGPKDFQKYRVIAKQGILLVRFSAQELLSRLDAAVLALAEGGFCPQPSELLQASEVPAVVLQEAFRQEVLPHGTIIQDWQPFKASESNLGLLREKDLCWVVDQKARPTVATLSTGPFAIPLGEGWLYLNIDAFGRDLAQLKSQLLHQLRLRAPRLHGRVMCQLFLEPSLWLEMAAFCQAGLGLELAKDYTEQYLLEADI
ncbi:probable N-acetyltransferase 16 isoform X2 [Hemicordylus capensis]|uniref:probable N-acetyltransferase 16 isoform X2 n=1 Tax=Hemicordylus capensis TaxID=884348 RepID=UPI0023021FEC|nr:probable N-acetyltransferase 16 isoform X2 [Hemicordylus capensis]